MTGDDPSGGEQTFSLEEILSEHRYDNTIKGRREKSEAQSDDGSEQELESILSMARTRGGEEEPASRRGLLMQLSMARTRGGEELKQAEEPPDGRERRETGVFASSEFDFSNNEEFQRMFAPSTDYLGEPPEPETDVYVPPEPEEIKPLLNRINDRAHRLREPVRDMPPAEAAKKLEPYVRSLTLRAFAALALNIPMLYISLSHRIGLPMPEAVSFLFRPYIYVFVVMTLQLLTMFCGLDVLARGAIDLFHLRPSAETGVVAACFSSIVHVFSILLYGPSWHAYLPYCVVSSLLVMMSIWGARLRCGARLRTYMVAKNAEVTQSVTMEDRIWEDVAGVTKREAAPEGFVPQTESPDNVQRFFNFFIPFALVASVVLAFLASFGAGRGRDFWWAWSAILSSVTPAASFIAFVLPFNFVSKRVAQAGVALAGWSAARHMSKANVAVLTDNDIFPGDTVSLNGIKVIGTHAYDKALSYTTSVVHASGSGLAKPFVAFFKGDTSHFKRITDFQHYEGGGMGAYIGSDRVLVGSYNFMVSMSVSVPSDLKTKHAVYTAINMELVAVFAMIYTPLAEVRGAIHQLSRNKVQPMFAVRDFNLTALLVKEKFKLSDDQIDYPVIEERLTLSDPTRKVYAKPVAIAGREGLPAYAESIVGSLALARTSRLNLLLSAICAAAGLLVVFYLIYTGAVSSATEFFNDHAATVSPVNILLYQLLWALPAAIVSSWAARY
ncbi:MAG: hypothetical protein FWH06_05145 [Oscillospiraceae bacterium]|nr:hypothetical protein [Oscillospiraceae bacterium]